MVASEGRPVQVAVRVLNVSESGFYAWRDRGPSGRSPRELLTDILHQIHIASNGACGGGHVHAELVLEREMRLGCGTVAMLMSLMSWAELKDITARRGSVRVRPCGPSAPEPVAVHRSHRTSHPRGQGVLRTSVRRVLAACGGLGDRFLAYGGFGHKHAGHGHRQPRSSSRTVIHSEHGASTGPGPSPAGPRSPGWSLR